jgi:LAO/AO transport system kinase
MSKKGPKKKSALRVQAGVKQPPPVDEEAASRYKGVRKKELSPGDYLQGIRSGNRSILSKAITLVESTLQEHQELAQEIIASCVGYSGKSVRVGITGVPGVGKSTFIESLGKHLTGHGHKIAVLAIDPSSKKSKGSILGDKTRMEELANDPGAFIRPSSSAGSLGGVARKTRESMILCEAAGYDVIFIETVGVGQSETAVHSMVDFFLLLMLAGAGDELQGIKRGIMEMADAIIINKADGDNVDPAKLAKAQYSNALHLFPASASGWIPRVSLCSSMQHSGIEQVWGMISEYVQFTRKSGYFENHRKEQDLNTLEETLEDAIKTRFYSESNIIDKLNDARKDILSGGKSPYQAAQELLSSFFRE